MAETSWEQKAAQVAEAINLLAVLAAPRLCARWCTQASSAELRLVLTDRMSALAAFCREAQGSPDADRFRAAVPTVQALADAVTGAPPGSISEPSWAIQARECLKALGFQSPPEGWDAFEGWPASSN